jgi:hypothetical protein
MLMNDGQFGPIQVSNISQKVDSASIKKSFCSYALMIALHVPSSLSHILPNTALAAPTIHRRYPNPIIIAL